MAKSLLFAQGILIITAVFGFSFLAAAAPPTTLFTIDGLISKNNQVIVHATTIAQGTPTPDVPNAPFTLVLQSDYNHELYRVSVALSGPSQTGEVPFIVRLPFFYSAKTIQIQHNGKVITSVDLPKLICAKPARTGVCLPYCQGRGLDPDCFQCGNGFCDPNETSKTCPIDCPAKSAAATAPAPTPPRALPYGALAVVAIVIALGAAGAATFIKLRQR